MQIILASAKIMHDRLKSIPDVSLSTPRFHSNSYLSWPSIQASEAVIENNTRQLLAQ